MLWLVIAFVCLLGLAAPAGLAAPDGPIRDPAGVKGYAVHEWGVFTIHPDLEMANAALAAEWADCPRELYRTEPPDLRNLPYRALPSLCDLKDKPDDVRVIGERCVRLWEFCRG